MQPSENGYFLKQNIQEMDILEALHIYDSVVENSLIKKAAQEITRNRTETKYFREFIKETVNLYGKPGGPWNIPSDPGGWLARARAFLEKRPYSTPLIHSMDTAYKDGSLILVFIKGKGWRTVQWNNPYGEPDSFDLWVMPGYTNGEINSTCWKESDAVCWMNLPADPTK